MELWQRLDRIPVTGCVLLAYVTMLVLTGLQPTGAILRDHGAAVGVLIMDGEPWRLLSYAFVHAGLIHFGFNTYCLVMVGPVLEEMLGSIKFAALYVVTALAGGIGGGLAHSEFAPLVGGSGALFGMFGAILAINMRRGRHLLEFLEHRGSRMIVTLIVLNLAIGFMIPRVSNAAHIGGLVAGFGLVFQFLEPSRRSRSLWLRSGWIALLLGWLLYALVPVGRADYQLREALRAEARGDLDAARARALAMRASGIPIQALIDEIGTEPGARWMRPRLERWSRGE